MSFRNERTLDSSAGIDVSATNDASADASARRVLSVYEVSALLKRSVEDLTLGYWLEGEVGRVTRAPSGHLYFSLKDAEKDAMIDVVMYRREATRFSRYIKEGQLIQLRGRASLYAPRGRLQWIGDAARAAGAGAQLLALAELKARLQAEGLFDEDRKQLLPLAPKLVGVITSRAGAAFHDICKVASSRSAANLLLCHAQVQGADAKASLRRALALLSAYPGVEVIIIGRGGGSQEDLMAFNDEALVREIAACPIPIVSAVGHETDFSLSDFAADVRAATPSQAAELVFPDEQKQLLRLRQLEQALATAMNARVLSVARILERVQRRLGDPRFALFEHQQSLDALSLDLEKFYQRHASARTQQLLNLSSRLRAAHPERVVERARLRLLPWEARLDRAMSQRLKQENQRLHQLGKELNLLSPLAGLGRGYALATDTSGKPLLSARQLRPGDEVKVTLKEGAFVADVKKIESES